MNTGSNNAKVIPLHAKQPGNNEAMIENGLARLPEPLRKVQEVAHKHLKASIQHLFDHVDDALFELADRAVSNLEQNVFFESMREIRIQRRGMEKGFVRYLDQHFVNLSSEEQASDANKPSSDIALDDDLSLVSKDELEELVAIDSLVSKSIAQNKHLLRVITARFDLMATCTVSEKNNPLMPQVLADGFVEASAMADVDIKAKLVLFKLFERYVMNELGDVLNQVNRMMTDLNVPMPNRRRPPASSAPAQANVPAMTPAPNGSVTDDPAGLYATLQSLIQPGTATGQPRSNFADTGYASHAADGYGVSEVSYALLSALSQLQQQQLQQVPVDQSVFVNQPQLLSSHQIQTVINDTTGEELLDDHSQDVIKLVDMLFSFILEDRNLPDPVKLLLARLQIPYIKVALADEGFFKKDGHPARRLLNEMATASIGWAGDINSRKRDPLLHKIESIVAKILEEFDSNFEIFTVLLTDFIAFVEKERRRVMLFEKRAIDAEDGKAKAEVGRQKVESLLNGIMVGKPLPKSFVNFVQGPWSNILFLVYMRQGENSKPWRSAIKIAEELVWSAQPIESKEHREQLLQLLPKLHVALRKGLDNISFNPAKQAQFLEKFKAHHTALLKHYQLSLVSEFPMAKAPVVDEKDDVAVTTSKAEPVEIPVKVMDEERGAAVDEAENHRVSEAQAADVAPAVESPITDTETPPVQEAPEVDAVTDTVVAEPNESALGEKREETEAATQAEVPTQQYLNLVDNFVVGVWFEKNDDNGSSYRCRLAAMIRGTGKYIFVNRAGVKVAEESRESLALLLQTGQLRTLDDSMLFDRALESLISSLRKP